MTIGFSAGAGEGGLGERGSVIGLNVRACCDVELAFIPSSDVMKSRKESGSVSTAARLDWRGTVPMLLSGCQVFCAYSRPVL